VNAAAVLRIGDRPAAPASVPHLSVAIVGSGFGGVGTAIRLRQAGIEEFLVFERADRLGGTWRDNRYPGAACDVPSHLYSFSFARNPRWSRWFSPQPEIRAYLEQCADAFGVRRFLRFGHDVQRIDWDDAAQRWRLQTSQGEFTAQFVVAAPGPLAEPRLPDLPGLASFAGPIFHTARWPEDLDLAGRRVAVIGTGASVIQVVPAIQPRAASVVVFQRTPPWVIPRHDFALRPRAQALLARFPPLARAVRGALYASHEIAGLPFRHPLLARVGELIARRQLRRQVRDPALRERLTPDYLVGCKRVLLSDDWYPAIQQPNVTLVHGAATAVTPRGVIGPDGVEHAADVLVLGTGFEVTTCPFAARVHGRGGRRLADEWTPSPRAHLGTTVAGYPNFFMLLGPNTALGHSSVVLMIEAQIAHVLNAIRHARGRGVGALEPRAEAQAAFVADVDRRMKRTVWLAGGCRSWYLDVAGRNSAIWPRSVGAFRRRVAPFRTAEYVLHPAHAVRAAAGLGGG
jgi:cation diffusion facilitator CzcD-associated flavoprotein CzcO